MVLSVLYTSVLLLTLWAPGSGSSLGGAPCASGSACPAREEEDSTSALQFSKSQVSKVEPETELSDGCPEDAACPAETGQELETDTGACYAEKCDPAKYLWKHVSADDSGKTCKVVCHEAGDHCGGFRKHKKHLCMKWGDRPDQVPHGLCIKAICVKYKCSHGSEWQHKKIAFHELQSGPHICVNPCGAHANYVKYYHFIAHYHPCPAETTTTSTEATTTTEAEKPVDCQPKREYCKQLCSATGRGWVCQYLCLFRWRSIKGTMQKHCDSCCQDGDCHASAASLAGSAESEGGAAAEADLALLEGLGEPGVDGSSEASQQVLDYLLDARSELAEEEVRKEVLEALEGVEASWCGDWSRWCTPLCKALSWPSKAAVSKCEEYCSEAAPDLAPVFHTYCKAGVCKSKGWPWASGTEEDVVASAAASP